MITHFSFPLHFSFGRSTTKAWEWLLSSASPLRGNHCLCQAGTSGQLRIVLLLGILAFNYSLFFLRQDKIQHRLASNCCRVKNCLEFLIIQSPPLEAWNHRCVPTCLVHEELEILGASCMLGKHWVTSPANIMFQLLFVCMCVNI